jgi:hypothetical protein
LPLRRRTKSSAWKVYTNARFGFSVRYPENWRLGNPMPDGIGVTLYPPVDNSLVAISSHMNILEARARIDGRRSMNLPRPSPHYHGTLRQENDHGEVAAGSGDVAGRIPHAETINIHVCG